MGLVASARRLMQLASKGQPYRIIMLGLDAAGKTTILYHLRSQVVTTIPTIGFNVETVECGHLAFTCWDVGGRDNIRPLWRHYFHGSNALLFVVDSNDRDRIEDARDELHKTLADETMRDVALLVYANKQDLPNAMTSSEVGEKLGLHDLRGTKWYLQGSCATSGEGLFEGLDWLSKALTMPQHAKETEETSAECSETATTTIQKDDATQRFDTFLGARLATSKLWLSLL